MARARVGPALDRVEGREGVQNRVLRAYGGKAFLQMAVLPDSPEFRGLTHAVVADPAAIHEPA